MEKVNRSYSSKGAGAVSGKATAFTSSEKATNECKEYKSPAKPWGKVGTETQG